MQLHYVDSPLEKASLFILSGLQVEIIAAGASTGLKAQATTKETIAVALAEHKTDKRLGYTVAKGQAAFQVRDSADCWIRIILQQGEGVIFPAGAYRQLLPLEGDSSLHILNDGDSAHPVVFEKRYPHDPDAVAVVKYHSVRELVCELCQQFFEAGWVTGTGGSISIRHGARIYMTPSGVQKERIEPDDLYVLDVNGAILCTPNQKPGKR